VLAVKDEYIGNNFPGYSAEMPLHGQQWVDIRRRERGSYPAIEVAHLFRCCQHCDAAPCKGAGKDGAVTKRADGIVVIDPQRAKGQKQVAEACPYGAAHWNETLSLPQHWNFDAHLMDAGWPAPRPVQACPTGALRVVKLEDEEMQRLARSEGLERIASGEKHGTRVYYRHLAMYSRTFVAGTLVGNEAGLEVCLAGGLVRLLRGADALASTDSDAFGDFRFADLPASSGNYRVAVSAQGYRAQELEFTLGDSAWLGEIRLEPA
jgi:Fe-S-cluster-containing dehydrogenase component